MKHLKLFEAFVNSDGSLKDFEPYSNSTVDNTGSFNFGGSYDSDMIFKNNEEFKEWVEYGLETGKINKISQIYSQLSKEHKKIVIDYFLDLLLLDEKQKNPNIVIDAIKYYPNKFREFLENNISYWWSFGNGVFEWNPKLIEILPLKYQNDIYNFIKRYGDYELDMNKEMFYAFDPIIRKKIENLNIFNII